MEVSTPLTTILSLVAAGMAGAGSVTYEDLEKILHDPARQIRSIDQFLAQPEFVPAFRRNFTTLFSSNSLQGASPLNPRIILYGEDSKLVLAFTCAPGDCVDEQSGQPARDLPTANSLELIHWKDDTKSFEFRKIDFPEAAQGTPVISEANPQRCMGCHMGPDPRPNWESYFTWPGAYGGNDDHLGNGLVGGESMDKLRQFIALAKTRPRYRHLEELAEGYENRGSRDNKEHNIDLTKELLVLNMSRLVNRIGKSPFYPDLKFALAVATQGSSSFTGQLQGAGFGDLASLLDQCVNPRYTTTPSPEFPSRVSQIVRLFYALGEPTLPWLLSFEPTLRSEAVSPADIDTDFWMEIRRQDPELDHDLGNADQLLQQGWRHMAQLPWLSDGIKKCITEVGPGRLRAWR